MTVFISHSSRLSDPHELEGALGLEDQTVRVLVSPRGVSAGAPDDPPDDPDDPPDESPDPPDDPPCELLDSTGAGLGGGGGESLAGS
jgi:hypothetical protein